MHVLCLYQCMNSIEYEDFNMVYFTKKFHLERSKSVYLLKQYLRVKRFDMYSVYSEVRMLVVRAGSVEMLLLLLHSAIRLSRQELISYKPQ